jgi:hypothetical protein
VADFGLAVKMDHQDTHVSAFQVRTHTQDSSASSTSSTSSTNTSSYARGPIGPVNIGLCCLPAYREEMGCCQGMGAVKRDHQDTHMSAFQVIKLGD